MDLSSRTSEDSVRDHSLRDHSLRASKEGLLSQFPDSEETPKCRACESRRKYQFCVVVPVLISLTLFVLLLGLGLTFSRSNDCYPFWSKTDFVGVKKELPKKSRTVHFTAGLRYNDRKELYRPIYPNQPQYVGAPSQEIDDAWEDLMGAVNIFVTPNEEPSLPGELYFQPESRLYMGQPTVFHDLHCLNMIRQNLPHYYDYYPHSNDSMLLPHLDHCLDGLRQSLMCAGDMTISPTIWSEEKGRIIPDFEVDHTCRDYDSLKQWARARDSADPNRYPQNAERLHAEGN